MNLQLHCSFDDNPYNDVKLQEKEGISLQHNRTLQLSVPGSKQNTSIVGNETHHNLDPITATSHSIGPNFG